MDYEDELLQENEEESDTKSEFDGNIEYSPITIINSLKYPVSSENKEFKDTEYREKTSFWFLKSEYVSLTITLIIVVFTISFVIYSAIVKNADDEIKIVAPDTDFNYALQIDLNHAEPQIFELLPGIGPKIAQKIIDYREYSGGFMNVDELENVKGISLRMVNRLRPFVYIEQNEKTAD